MEGGALEHISNDTLQDYLEGGGAVTVEEQAGEVLEIPTISRCDDASKF